MLGCSTWMERERVALMVGAERITGALVATPTHRLDACHFLGGGRSSHVPPSGRPPGVMPGPGRHRSMASGRVAAWLSGSARRPQRPHGPQNGGVMAEHYDVIIIGTGQAEERSHTRSPVRVSASCCWSAGTSCPVRWTTGIRGRCSSTGSTSPRTPGSAATANRSSPRSTTSWAGRPRCTARPCTGCGRRTSASSSTSTGSPRPGRCLRRLRAVVHPGRAAVSGARQWR